MSRTQLKKELAALDRDQLIQIILDHYSARKDAKAYYDFFLNPDVEALSERYMKLIDKELSRGSYGKSTARFSRVRTAIREFASFGVSPEYVVSLMLATLRRALEIERIRFVTSAFLNAMTRLASDVLNLGDREGIFDSTIKSLEDTLSGNYGALQTVNRIRSELDWSLVPRKPGGLMDRILRRR